MHYTGKILIVMFTYNKNENMNNVGQIAPITIIMLL